jgi:hypothetical protein
MLIGVDGLRTDNGVRVGGAAVRPFKGGAGSVSHWAVLWRFCKRLLRLQAAHRVNLSIL